ncbi:MAG TPA: GIY-YIG nuclease family protein [Tenuifilaceae bacterium]|nr:GIY-YIG nuclease family protein [Bacteroidales bacterium]MDI9517640.1 GIY-YIG nuclease family protein [Bacteroidota bacterium]NLH57230.1 GIY-YIG nuclease family protein [Rikenellaceae bacterium]HNV80586.1 GIY-YIG nuclease family protein [Tenuifilaceae bacterium]MZP83073.1 GIY-YIG nuclease family protein [Bacteroidales bacterium]
MLFLHLQAIDQAYYYILFSRSLNRFYVGVTSDSVECRLQQHWDKLYGSRSFTARANDWEVVLTIPCNSLTQALRIEKYIKRMKSRRFIEQLIEDEAMLNRLKQRFA